jgi:hypothetical protein
MKLTDLRSCDSCGQAIAPVFYRVTVEQLGLDRGACQQNLAMHQYFGGNAQLGEMFSPHGDVTRLLTTCKPLLLCNSCFTNDPVLLRGLELKEDAVASR